MIRPSTMIASCMIICINHNHCLDTKFWVYDTGTQRFWMTFRQRGLRTLIRSLTMRLNSFQKQKLCWPKWQRMCTTRGLTSWPLQSVMKTTRLSIVWCLDRGLTSISFQKRWPSPHGMCWRFGVHDFFCQRSSLFLIESGTRIPRRPLLASRSASRKKATAQKPWKIFFSMSLQMRFMQWKG